MKILFTGKGKSGSYKIRAEQMGVELGARVVAMACVEECRRADVIVVVKRIPDQLLMNIRASGRPWVYDIVDPYPQPACTDWSESESKAWLSRRIEALSPDLVIWSNERMQKDGDGGAVVYHHHRPGLAVNPIRERIEVVGYEGGESFLGEWRTAIELECRKRGARFVVNPERLADVDVVLALRGKSSNGYPQRHWKSNVKLANAHGSGTPFIGARECGYTETACGAEQWAEDVGELAAALDRLESRDVRRDVRDQFLKAALPIGQVAKRYMDVLCAR